MAATPTTTTTQADEALRRARTSQPATEPLPAKAAAALNRLQHALKAVSL